jgi:hypothetical protein
VERLLTADVAREIAATFGDQPVYPQHIVVDSPAEPSLSWWRGSKRRFPGWPGPVLVVSDENQCVCSWGVPLDGGSSRVLVGGDLLGTGYATVPYAASVEDFIAARRWDRKCLASAPVLQAQAAELDQASLGYLTARLAPAVATAGWPGPRQYRFEDQDVRVMLWSQTGQCDWWISASSQTSLTAFTAGLLDLSDLRSALWSNDDFGARLLDELRTAPHLRRHALGVAAGSTHSPALGTGTGDQAKPMCRTSSKARHYRRLVTQAVCHQVGAGTGGLHGVPVMAARRTSMTPAPCLRAVSM